MIIWDKQASNEEKAQAIEEALVEAETEKKEEEGSFLRNEFGLGQ
jgi:hypothetical protein